jgi:hypothetical protein
MTTLKRWDGPPLDAWRAWHPREAAAVLSGLDIAWCVVGGWAIDLWLGRETRAHGDLEVAIARGDFERMRAQLRGYVLHSVGDGEVRLLADDADPPADSHQNWVLDPRANEWRMDVMLEPGDAQTWVFRRDESIRATRASMIGTRDGIPFLKAHGALLYKAKRAEPKDEHDFAVCAPRLDGDERAWLIDALGRVHPGHAWIAALGGR